MFAEFKHLVEVIELAKELFEQDERKTADWLLDPNHLFFGQSPYEMVLGGRAEGVLQTLREWKGV